MKLPNVGRAIAPEAKFTDYLLSHAKGEGKAAFFLAFGFRPGRWQELGSALRQYASDHEIEGIEQSRHGTVYTVVGVLGCPDGRSPLVRSVWIIRIGEDVPRLVTAYPR